MSFISSALGTNNGFAAQSAAVNPNFINQNGQNLVANGQLGQNAFNQAISGQSALSNALSAQAQGQGPNIAQLQLQQATNQNNQQAAGQLASQRGMNPALAQRLIAQNQAANNQNAAGQAGVLRAQQQLSAQGQLGNVLSAEGGLGNQNLAANQAAIANQNQGLNTATNAGNQVNAQIAQNNVNQNAGIVGRILGGASSVLQGLSKGGPILNPEHHLEQLLISIGAKIHPLHLAGGGTAMNAIDPGLAQGAPNIFGGIASGGGGPQSVLEGMTSVGPSASGGSVGGSAAGGATMAGGPLEAAGSLAPLALAAARGGKVPVMLSPGELKIPAHKVAAVAAGKARASQVGARVPGKAKVKGDNEKNDVFPTMANAGDVIVKRTKAQNDADAREFLQALAKDKEKKNGPSGYAKILALKRKNAA